MPQSLQPMSASTSTSAYYVFNDAEEGFVIIAGDDAVSPILGYSSKGTFHADSIPDGLQYLLETYRLQIEALSETDSATSYEGYIGENCLKTLEWWQSEPFNNKCPSNCPTGCVATAMGIIMAYHRYPAQGRGVNSYKWQHRTLRANFSKSFYDWDNLLALDEDYPEEWDDAVADLLYDLGISVNMNYGTEGSEATTWDAAAALVRYFDYSMEIKKRSHASFDDGEWKEMLRKEIDMGRPLLYSGTSTITNIGHAFVVDGYRNDLFSINWGWGGIGNGFFQLGDIVSDSNVSQYSLDQSAIFNIYPSDGKGSRNLYYLGPLSLEESNGFAGLVTNSTDVKAHTPFQAWATRIYNGGHFTYNSYVYLTLSGAEGTIREVLDSVKVYLPRDSSLHSPLVFDCMPTIDAEEGDSIILCCRDLYWGDQDMEKVYDVNFNIAYVPAVGNEPVTANLTFELGSGITCTESAANDTCAIKYNGKYLVGSPYYFDLKFPEDAALNVVRINGVRQNILQGNTVPLSMNLGEEEYTIEAHSYRADELIDRVTVVVSNPGSLEADLANYNADLIQHIIVKGEIDKRDLDFLNDSRIGSIDLEAAEIVAYKNYAADCIPNGVFAQNTSLTRLVLPAIVSHIGYKAFAGSGLKDIIIPESVTSYAPYALSGCPSLSDIVVLNPEPLYLYSTVIDSTMRMAETSTLHVPVGCVDIYRATTEWELFTNIVEDADDIFADIETVRLSAAEAGVTVNGRTISVTDAECIAVYNAEGKCVSRSAKTTVAPGFYIVVVDGKSVKVAVN